MKQDNFYYSRYYKHFTILLVAIYLLIYDNSALLFSLLFLASSFSLGAKIVSDSTVALFSIFLKTLVGISVYIAILNVMVLFPINVKIVYTIMILIPIVVFFKEFSSIVYFINGNRNREKVSFLILYAITLILLLYVGTGAFLPPVNYDDLAYHNYLQNSLFHNKQFLFDVKGHIWSVSPWSIDLLHSVPYILSGVQTHSTLNFFFFVSLAVFVFSLASNFTNRHLSLLATMSIISTPLIYLSLTSSQTELFVATLVVAIVLYVIKCMPKPKIKHLYVIMLLLAAMLSAKTTSVFIVLPVLCFVLFKYKNFIFSKQILTLKFGLFVILSLVIALESYIVSYFITGNPVFPLFNAVFKSEFFPIENFFNSTYLGNFSWQAFYDIFINSSKYLETSSNYILGFQYALFYVLMVYMILFHANKKYLKLWLIVFVIILYIIPVFKAQQYIRYFVPILPLVSIVIVVLFDKNFNKSNILRFISLLIFIIALFFNIANMKKVIWYLRDGSLWSLDIEKRKKFIEEKTPELLLNSYLNRLEESPVVLYDCKSRAYGANLNGKAIYTNWYNHIVRDERDKLKSEEGILNFIYKYNISHVIVDQSCSKKNLLFKKFYKKYGTLKYSVGTSDLYRLTVTPLNLSFSNKLNMNKVGKPIFDNKTNTWKLDNKNYLVISFDQRVDSNIVNLKIEFEKNKKDINWINHIEWHLTNGKIIHYYRLIEVDSDIDINIKVPAGVKNAILYLQPYGDSEVNLKSFSIKNKIY